VISGATQVAAVIGHPIAQSLSPAMHNAAFAETGLDWVFVALAVRSTADVPAALHAVRALGIRGLSVTMPHKAAVADEVDELAPAAAVLRSVNCVVADDGRLVGHSTDGDGLVDSLRLDAGFDVNGSRVVVLGAGGAARSIVAALATAGAADIAIVNRTASAAAATAALASGRVGSSSDIGDADLVVNATSVGMGTADVPCDPALIRAGAVVVDIVIDPLDTAFLQACRARRARTLDGLGMLVHQGARAFTMWTGVDAPVDVMRSGALAQLSNRASTGR
jgi:shikimate dehydrogenase